MNTEDKILIVTATRHSKPREGNRHFILQASLDDFPYQNFDLKTHYENKAGLPRLYNEALVDDIDNYDIILFVHDDVYIDDLKCFHKIREKFNAGYSVVGLAGATEATVKAPALWHLMSEQKNWSGAVGHPSAVENSVHVTSFGPVPQRCLILDGLFLAIDCSKFRDNLVKFDEQFTFHHYDIDFCLQCNAAKHKLTTMNINVLHNSPGLSNINNPDYTMSQAKFLKKYGKH
jgi:hypothetical protein